MIGNHFLGDAQIQSLRPRVTGTWCHIWRIARADGVVLRFASHDKVVWFAGERYEPLGPTASDLEQSEAGGESDFQMVGFLSSDTIRASDIQAGRYDGCRVTHFVIDWMRPWPNAWVRKHVWWVKTINESGGLFRAEVQGVERFLTIPAGRTYERECEKVLGSIECGAVPRTLFGLVVEAVATPSSQILGLPHHTMAFRLTTASWTWSPLIRDGLLMQGKVVWSSGPNRGTSQIIGEHIGRELTLETETPFPIRAGDTCDLWSGCNGTIDACTNDYSNRVNYGGQRFMPSTEDTYRKPSET